ncbi:DUF4197 domain-containing protein [Sneathiella limimaris]|uniref:DUF4197 domain-containing protein n=1 Tax=Sneathiella limimaris TaxID=1964213 RepID=UPI00146ED858|nr:DUF4197 domain-containing protein [Sneathiella limimaris]
MKSNLFRIIAITFAFAATTAPAKADFLKSLKDTVNKATSPTTNTPSSQANGLSISEITKGLKEALKVGTGRVVNQIGASGGYENDPAIHIPLPEKMQKAQTYLRKFGLSSMADEVETKLNKGAEAAAPKAKELIINAISEMTLDDAQKIYNGPDDAATQYFRKVSTADLMETVRPVIDQSLEEVGAIAAYNSLIKEYKKIPLVPDVQSDLTEHATHLALEGLFHYLAVEEAAIRNNPVARTTDILKSVFGRS